MAPSDVTAEQVRAAQKREEADTAPPMLVRHCTACWIEVELRDEEEDPVPNEPYWIKLADGSVREGRLNKQGLLRLDGIPCGTCTVRFPKYDKVDVQWKTAQQAGLTDWIEIHLLDEADRPMGEAEYAVQLPDGSSRTGKLDKKGRARLEELPAGTCQVRFPGIDDSDFVGG